MCNIKTARRVIIGAGVQRAASPLLGFAVSPKNPSLNGFDIKKDVCLFGSIMWQKEQNYDTIFLALCAIFHL
jgi:hypothetical protein